MRDEDESQHDLEVAEARIRELEAENLELHNGAEVWSNKYGELEAEVERLKAIFKEFSAAMC